MILALLTFWLAAPKDPCARLDMADVIRIVAEVDVLHVPIPPIECGGGKVGVNLGTYAEERKQIVLNVLALDSVARLALLHELYHARQRAEKRPNDDGTVRACALAAYVRLFGGDMDLPPQMRRDQE